MNTMETVQFDEAMFEIRKLLTLHEREPYNKDEALMRFAQISAYAAQVFLATFEPVVPRALLVPKEQTNNLYDFVKGYSDTSDLAIFINTTDFAINSLNDVTRKPRYDSPDRYPYLANIVAMQDGEFVIFGNHTFSGEKIRDFVFRETNKKYAHITEKFPDLVNYALRSNFFKNLMS